jgi:hypothetical protein
MHVIVSTRPGNITDCAKLKLLLYHSVTLKSAGQVKSTDHELIPLRNESLPATGSNVLYYPTRKYLPLKERNEQSCYNAYN